MKINRTCNNCCVESCGILKEEGAFDEKETGNAGSDESSCACARCEKRRPVMSICVRPQTPTHFHTPSLKCQYHLHIHK
jgi:hypothetical protein